jgi:hypothetical protein
MDPMACSERRLQHGTLDACESPTRGARSRCTARS